MDMVYGVTYETHETTFYHISKIEKILEIKTLSEVFLANFKLIANDSRVLVISVSIKAKNKRKTRK